MHFSRRNFLRLSGTGLLATQAPSLLATHSPGLVKGPEIPFELGIASYTFREFSLEETVAMTAKLNIPKLCLKSMHMPLDSTADEIKGMVAIFTYGFDVATKNFNDANVDLHTLGNYENLLEQALDTHYITEKQQDILAQWNANPSEWNAN